MDSQDPARLHTVTCRPALAKDYADMLELTRTIWDGHDYVPHEWQDWLREPEGLLASAEYAGRVVGVGRLELLSPGDWWLMGLRVHPEYRGMKIASHLHDYLLGWWQAHDSGTIRLSTMDDRFPVHHMCERSGFQPIMNVRWDERPVVTDPAAAARFRPVDAGEAEAAMQTLLGSEMLPLYHHLIDRNWIWARPHTSHIRQFIAEQKLWWWQAPDGSVGLMGGYDEEDDDDQPIFMMCLPACRREHFAAWLLDGAALGAALGTKTVQVCTPGTLPLPELIEGGYRQAWDHTMVVFEKGAWPATT